MQMMEGKDRRPRGIDLLQGSARSPAARLPLDPAPFCGLPRPTGMTTLHEELSGARRRRIKIALQKDTTREVLEGWQALEGWLP